MTAPALRDYQLDVIRRFDEAVAAKLSRVLIVAPTGAGKTVIGAAIIARRVQAGGRVLFLAHRRELVTQASAKLHAVGIDHGIIQAGWPTRPGEPVQVASIQTLDARAIRSAAMDLPPADLVVIDEAHRARARTYRKVMDAYPAAVVLGLTATPCRGDGRGLGNTFQAMVECPDVGALIGAGHLVPTRVYAPSRPDLSGVRVERGDYVEKQLADRMNKADLVGDVVSHWLRLAERRRTVVFATGVAHSVHLRDEFLRAGVLAEHLDGSTPAEERAGILKRLASGAVELLTNCAVLTEGWDSPEVSCCVLARPTKSIGLFRQMVGRVLRPAPGKVDALVIDHAGAVFDLGFVEDPITWTLHEDKRAENTAQSSRSAGRAPALATCPECSAIRREGQPCPACAWRPKPKPRPVEVTEGELGQVDRSRRVNVPIASAEARLAFFRMLAWIARERGFKPGWAAHKFKEKHGDWPIWRDVEPLPPDEAVRAWVRSRQIAWARERTRGAA